MEIQQVGMQRELEEVGQSAEAEVTEMEEVLQHVPNDVD